MILGARETQSLLKKYKISVPAQALCKNFSELAKNARRMKPPCVLKALSAGATHKTEAGLVELNLADAKSLEQAFRRISKRAKAAGIAVEYFLLQQQLGGVEFIVGGKRDASFGQTIVFGLGGTMVELFKDYSLRVTPIVRRQASEMIAETKASAFVKGFRGKKVSEKALLALLLKTSKLLEENPEVTELDFNPVIADEKRALVVDARIIVEDDRQVV